MGFWDALRGELIDIIEWLDDDEDTMVWRFERHENEIKHGAQLTVREGQVAVFVNEGTVADVFPPGRHVLETANLPVLATLQGWKYGFDSPFKAEVYFFKTTRFRDLKWGTKNPVMLRDPEFGPIRLRAFGTYEVKVADPKVFLREVVGTDGHFTTDEVADQLRNLIVARFSAFIGGCGIPALDLASSYDQLGAFAKDKLSPEFAAYGLDLITFLVENISLPEAVQQALDKRSSMGVIGDLGRYTQYQAAESIQTAAANPGGLASAGIGLGAGLAMANQMGAAMGMGQPQQQWGQQPRAAQAPAAPPPIPPQVQYYLALSGQQAGPFDMNALRQQLAAGSLTKDTLVWADGMAGWTAAGQVPALSALFAPTPPPIPGGPPPIPTASG